MESYVSEAPCLYFSSLDDGTILEVNDTLCRQLGYTREGLTGKKADVFFTLSTRIFQQTHLFPLLKIQGQAEEIYITLHTKDKEPLPVLINAERKSRNEKFITSYVGILVRNRKKFEDELLAAKKAAEKALNENTALLQAKLELQKHAELLDQQMYLVSKQNEELRQFNRVITHDLQEPLRKLFLFTNKMLDTKEEEAIANSVLKIKSVSEQMRSLVSGLQQYVWLTETPVKSATIQLQDLLEDLRIQIENENVGLTIHLVQEDLPALTGDSEQIRFLFQEILSNSIRFRKKPDEVSVHITATSLQQNQFKSFAGKYQYSTYIKLQVKDDGTGFDAAYKNQVFELFKRLHPVSGRGIGLSLCKKIVENHQGSITIDSKAGEGTTVNILLPFQRIDLSNEVDINKLHSNTTIATDG